MGSCGQTLSIGVIILTRKYTTKSEELRFATWQDESGSDLGEILCDAGRWTEVIDV